MSSSPTSEGLRNVWCLGIGVSELQRSEQFYVQNFGFKRVGLINLPHIDEIVLSLEPGSSTRGSRVMLMHWKDGVERNYRDNPTKLIFEVEDAAAIGERMKVIGAPIVRDVGKSMLSDNVYGIARDPDGYLVEYLQILERHIA